MCLAVTFGTIAASGFAQTPTNEEAACSQGDLVACNGLGISFERTGNYPLAANYFRKTCDGGLLIGCSNLGEYYFDGRAVQSDIPRAFRLFMSACTNTVTNGCAGACVVVLEQGTASTVSKFTEDCVNAVQRSCDNGNSWMCPHAKRLQASAAARANARPAGPAVSAPGACPDSIARLVARAYTLSNPFNDPNEFATFVASNRAAFQTSGAAVTCAAALGTRLAQAGMAAYDPNAYERAMGAGPAELAPNVAQSINSGALDMFAMGQELSWLATIFPEVARGSLRSFLSSGTDTRVQLRNAMEMMNQLASMNRDFAQNLGFARAIAGFYSPMADEQILMLARMMPR